MNWSMDIAAVICGARKCVASLPGRRAAQSGKEAKRRLNRPDGQISKNLSSPLRKNILIFRKRKSPYNPRRPVPTKRGVSRSSRTLGAGCDGRKSPGAILCADERRFCGRRSRVVLMPRRWHQVGGAIRR
jgi:hypothetical protein